MRLRKAAYNFRVHIKQRNRLGHISVCARFWPNSGKRIYSTQANQVFARRRTFRIFILSGTQADAPEIFRYIDNGSEQLQGQESDRQTLQILLAKAKVT